MGFHEDDRIRRKNAKPIEQKENVYCSNCATELGFSTADPRVVENEHCPNCGKKTLYKVG